MQSHTVAKELSKQLNRATLLKILENSYDGIFATDKNGITFYANKACETYYGVKPEDVIGQDPWILCQDKGCFPPAVPIALHNRERCTVEQCTPTGAHVLITTTVVYDKTGNIEFLVQNTRDIKQLEDTKTNLNQAQAILARIKGEVIELRRQELRDLKLIAKSTPMKGLLNMADRAARVDANILLLGETGTGKSALAKYIHKVSPRKDGPFISINCAALAGDIIESELFGYVGGAFTGALSKGKVGLLELAHQGTLFLDEIAELPLRLQGKLLDVIQDRRFIPVGGCESRVVDCRIVAATNRDILKMIKNREFREDLYYRLSVVELEVKPLRERPEDIYSLIYFFLNKFNKKYRMEHDISDECRNQLIRYCWPGNIRELEHLIERLVVIVPEPTIEVFHLPAVFLEEPKPEKTPASDDSSADEKNRETFDDVIASIAGKLVQEAYSKYGTTRKVAQALNITQTRAQRLVTKYCK